ncbi:MAG: hypothetical protein IPI66_07180 [Chitinophagaceae bacterium]|nr:hypothetical protein [Chitinophagaceae bacterium]
MCFHYSLTKERTAIELLLHADWDDMDWQPVHHADGFTFPAMPVITGGTRQDQNLSLGLIPHWVNLIRCQPATSASPQCPIGNDL